MKVLNIKKAIPMFTGIITTCERYTEDECKHGSIIDSTKINQIKDIQKIISLSDSSIARGLKEGMTLSLSLVNDIDEHYSKEMYYEVPTIILDYKEHLLLDIQDISLIIDDYEYINEGEGLLSGETVMDLSGLKPKLIL
jgi:hypothetical protein